MPFGNPVLMQNNTLLASGIIPEPVYLSVVEANGSITSANHLMKETFSLPDTNQQQANFFDLVHPVYLDNFKRIFTADTENGQLHEMDLYVKNGSWHYMKWYVGPLDQPAAGNKQFLCYGYEIANHEKEVEAVDKEDISGLLVSFAELTPHLAWIVDEEANLVFANEAFYQHFGKTSGSYIGKNMSEVVPQVVMQAMYELHTKVLSTGEAVHSEHKVKWTDGTNLISYINIFPIGSHNGKQLLAGQAIHVKDKSGFEQQLQKEHQRFLDISKATSDAIWEWDMKTGKVFQNEKLLAMIGSQQDAGKGLTWWLRRIHPKDRNIVADKLKESTEKQEQSWQSEYRFRFADETYHDIIDKGFIMYENGLPIKMIGALHEKSHIRSIENELAEEKLKQEKKLASTINHVHERERSRIGYKIQNSINQLLSAAQLQLDNLHLDSPSDEKIKLQSEEYIQAAIDELRKLSKELSTPSIKEKGLAACLHDLVSITEIPGTLDIQYNFQDEVEELSLYQKISLYRIIQEQLKNIVQHSDATQCHLQLQKNNDGVRLTIDDNGSGFDPEQTHRGHGFSNIRGRVDFFNGTLDIRSFPGKGCSLIVAFPV